MNANAKMNAKIMKATMVLQVIAIIFMILTLCGCEEAQQRPVWGKGELPADHQKMFGDGNNSRLNYVQSQAINKHGALITEIARRILIIEAVDPNAIPVETRLDLLETALIKEAQGFRGANPIEGMVRWDHDGSEELEVFTEGEWARIMSRHEMLSESEIEKLMDVEAVE